MLYRRDLIRNTRLYVPDSLPTHTHALVLVTEHSTLLLVDLRPLLRCRGGEGGPVTECNTLLVEGAEADDIAAFLVRTFLDAPLPGDAASQVISNRHVVLLTADGDWLQYMEHPHVHCVDVLGALRRPEWLQVRFARLLVCVASLSRSSSGPQIRGPDFAGLSIAQVGWHA